MNTHHSSCPPTLSCYNSKWKQTREKLEKEGTCYKVCFRVKHAYYQG